MNSHIVDRVPLTVQDLMNHLQKIEPSAGVYFFADGESDGLLFIEDHNGVQYTMFSDGKIAIHFPK